MFEFDKNLWDKFVEWKVIFLFMIGILTVIITGGPLFWIYTKLSSVTDRVMEKDAINANQQMLGDQFWGLFWQALAIEVAAAVLLIVISVVDCLVEGKRQKQASCSALVKELPMVPDKDGRCGSCHDELEWVENSTKDPFGTGRPYRRLEQRQCVKCGRRTSVHSIELSRASLAQLKGCSAKS